MIAVSRSGRSSTRHAARVAWLKAHPDLWASVPSDSQDVTDDNRPGLHGLDASMVKAGLLRDGRKSKRCDTIRRLIGELRG